MKTLLDPKIALGRDSYVKKYTLRGRNAAISTSAETVWGAGATYAHLTTPAALEVVSGSANDTALGTGARTVYVEAVDNNFDLNVQTLSLNGATAVDLTGTHYGANVMRVASAGSSLQNEGIITLRVDGAGATKRTILLPGTPIFSGGLDTDFIFIVPRNHVALLGSVYWSGTTITGSVSVGIKRVDLTTGLIFWENCSKISLDNTSFCFGQGFINLGKGLLIPEKNAIELQAIATAGAGDFCATAELFLFDLSKISSV